VAFYESFWVATSAAAPVIALAAVVALPDASTVRSVASRRYRRRRDQIGDRHPLEAIFEPLPGARELSMLQARSAWSASLLVWGTTLVNLVVQAGLLAVSLSALAYQQNVMPPWLAIFLAVGGILLLAWSTTTVIKFPLSKADEG